MRTLTKEQFVERASALVGREVAEEFAEPSGDLRPEFAELSGAVVSVTLDPGQGLFWVGGVAGKGLDWMRELARIAKLLGYRYIGFKARKTARWTAAFARYSKARVMESGADSDEFCFDLSGRF